MNTSGPENLWNICFINDDAINDDECNDDYETCLQSHGLI
jgi:hypothetical protein